jgi:hypothetical protein
MVYVVFTPQTWGFYLGPPPLPFLLSILRETNASYYYQVYYTSAIGDIEGSYDDDDDDDDGGGGDNKLLNNALFPSHL